MQPRVLSLFAGIGGFDLAFERAGAECLMQVERDQTCRSILARHWPSVQRLDDVRKYLALLEPRNASRVSARPVRPDIIVGGFPCQDISVAGQRAGLAGSRSGLWFVFRRIIALHRPGWVCIENVPGLLSSGGRRDLGTILWALGQLGYGWAYRVLDSQWFGVPQRRQRVFIVGCFGDARRAGEVLFESDSLPWDSPPRRQKGTRVAASITSGSATGCGVNRPGRRREDDVNLAFGGNNTSGPIDVATACTAHGGTGRHDFESETFVACETAAALDTKPYADHEAKESRLVVTHALTGEGHDASEDGTGRGTPLVPMAFNWQSGGSSDFVAPSESGTSSLSCTQTPAIAYQCHGVRRLMPIECERLQAFPDNWTAFGVNGEPISDSARYRALGNAVTVSVVEWIARRMLEFESSGVPTTGR